MRGVNEAAWGQFPKAGRVSFFPLRLADDTWISTYGARGSADASPSLSECSGHINPSSVLHSPFLSTGCPPDSSEGTGEKNCKLH